MHVSDEFSREDIRNIYQAVAEGKPREDVLTMIYDLFSRSLGLRPPADELRLAQRVSPKSEA